MDKEQLGQIETLLQIIADEMYIARMDRESDGQAGEAFADWETKGRPAIISAIAGMRKGLKGSKEG